MIMRNLITAAALICLGLATPAHAADKDRVFHFDKTKEAGGEACADPTVLPQVVVDFEVDRANHRQDVDHDLLDLLKKGRCQPLLPTDTDQWRFVRTTVVFRFEKPTTVVLMRYVPVPSKPELAQAYSQLDDQTNGGGFWFLPSDLVDDAGHHPGDTRP
jgi:hypothetical protein